MNERQQLKQVKDIYGRDRGGNWISDETREECIGNIVEILRDQLSFQEPRYLLVRIRGGIPEQKYHENFFESIESLSLDEQDLFEERHRHRRYDMRGNVDDISVLLFTPPKKHTIVFVKEKMKCAQTLEYVDIDEKTGKATTHQVKHNIGVVVERKRLGGKEDQNDSFAIQGFLGRLCGYDPHNCICYTNMKSYEKYEQLFDSNFDPAALKRVSWNSNTTSGKGNGKGTNAQPNINDDCVDEDEVEEVVSTRRVYKSDWIKTTKATWKADWRAYCEANPGPEVEAGVHNPFVQAEKHITPNGLWKGQHRGWHVLKFDTVTKKLFECDEHIVAVKETDAGLTGTDTTRRCVCYNTQNELGVYISRCVGKVARRLEVEDYRRIVSV